MLRLGVLVSGGGTNLQAVIDRIRDGRLRDTEISLVISNREDAYALKRAEAYGIPAACISPKHFESREAYEREMIRRLEEAGAGLVVLAGFLVILSPLFVEHFAGKVINIHPSLIPSFCGDGCYGLRVHEQVLARGVKITGATVHFVDAGTDTGPIILQRAVEVEPDDTPESLQKRVMEQAEWKILPEVIDAIAHDRVQRNNNNLCYIIK